MNSDTPQSGLSTDQSGTDVFSSMRDRTTMLFMLALLAIMTLYPVLFSWYTTTDDIFNAMGIDGGWCSPLLVDARRSGRLVHVLAGQLMCPSYGWGSYWLMKAMTFSAFLANVAGMALVLRVFTGNSRLGLIAATFFFAFIPNTWDHNLLTAYPFTSPFAITLFLLSVAFWWVSLQEPERVNAPVWLRRRSRRTLVVVSAIFFGTTLLIYESFLTYAVVFPVMAAVAAGGPIGRRLRAAVRTPHVWVLAFVFLLMIGFRLFLITDEGLAFNAGEQYETKIAPWAVLKVLERYTSSAMPMHYFRVYRDLINDFYLGYGTFRSRLVDMFRVVDTAWMVKAAIVAFIVTTVLRQRMLVRHRGLVLTLALVMMILTHLPLAISAKYQTWVLQHYNHAYMTSYFAFLGVVMFLALIVDALVAAAARWHRAVAHAVIGVVAVAVFVTSYGSDFINAHVAASQQQMWGKWRTVDAWIASDAFKALPEGSIVYAPSLWEHYPGQTHVWDDYWTRYVTQYGRKPIQMVNTPEEWQQRAQMPGATSKLYFLKVIRERRDESSYLLFGRVGSSDVSKPMAMTDIAVLSHVKSDHLRVIGRLSNVGTACRARVFVDGVPSSGTYSEIFTVDVDKRRPETPWVWTRLTAAGGVIDPESIMLAASSEPLDGAVDMRFGTGFFPDEVNHRWAENDATLTLLNRSDRPIEVNLTLQLRAPSALDGKRHSLDVVGAGEPQRWSVSNRLEKHQLIASVPPVGSVDVVFKTDAPRIDPAVDGRNLVLMFVPPLRAEETGGCPSETTD